MRGFRLVFLLVSVAAAPLFLAAIQPEQDATTAAKFFIKIVAITVPLSIGYMTLEDAARDKDIMWDENDSAFGISSSSFFHKTKEFAGMMFMLTLGCMAVSAFRRSFDYGTLFPAALATASSISAFAGRRLFKSRFSASTRAEGGE